MTWEELWFLLGQEEKKFCPPRYMPEDLDHLRPEGRDLHPLALFEEQVAPGLGAAIRVFSRTRQWPPMSDEEKSCLYWRLSAVLNKLEFVRLAATKPGLGISEPTLDEEDLIEWV
jgi:hypothetical protein